MLSAPSQFTGAGRNFWLHLDPAAHHHRFEEASFVQRFTSYELTRFVTAVNINSVVGGGVANPEDAYCTLMM